MSFLFYGTLLSYAALVILVGWSAFRTSNSGWRSGLLLAFMMASIPFWVGGMFWVYCFLAGQEMGIGGR